MEIQITDNFKLVKDPHCWQVYKFTEGGKPIPSQKGKVSESGWKPCGKFYTSIPQALRYISEQELNKGNTQATFTIQSYIDAYEESAKEVMSKFTICSKTLTKELKILDEEGNIKL